jgi:C4-dicarboxylate-binding protein DctP
MKKRHALIVIVSLLSIVLFTAGSACSKEIILKYATGARKAPGWNVNSTPYLLFVTEVENRSNGRIKVDFHWGGEIGSPIESVMQTRQGLLQLTSANTGHFASIYPAIQIFSIPYLFLDRQIAWRVLTGDTYKAMTEDMVEKTGLRMLAFRESGGFRHFSNSKRPLRSAADIKGLKLRTMQSPLFMQIVKDLGGSPTPIPFTELYSALQLKVVDGQENPISIFRWPKLEEVQKYIILDGHVYSLIINLVNEKWFQNLPKDLQATIYQADAMSANIHSSLSYLQEGKDIQELRDMGIEVFDPSIEVKNEFREKTQASAIEWLRKQKNIDPKWVDMVLEEVKKVEKELGYAQ